MVTLLGLDRFLAQQGLDVATLLGFSAVIGFAGSIISLLAADPGAAGVGRLTRRLR